MNHRLSKLVCAAHRCRYIIFVLWAGIFALLFLFHYCGWYELFVTQQSSFVDLGFDRRVPRDFVRRLLHIHNCGFAPNDMHIALYFGGIVLTQILYVRAVRRRTAFIPALKFLNVECIVRALFAAMISAGVVVVVMRMTRFQSYLANLGIDATWVLPGTLYFFWIVWVLIIRPVPRGPNAISASILRLLMIAFIGALLVLAGLQFNGGRVHPIHALFVTRDLTAWRALFLAGLTAWLWSTGCIATLLTEIRPSPQACVWCGSDMSAMDQQCPACGCRRPEDE